MSWTRASWTRRADGSFCLPFRLSGQLMANQPRARCGTALAVRGQRSPPRHPRAPHPPAPAPARLSATSRRDHGLSGTRHRAGNRTGGDRGRGMGR